jgi:hypothetical protein
MNFWNSVIDIVIMTAVARHMRCGQTAVWLSLTCKRVYALVHKTKRLAMLMRYHVVSTTDLERTIPVVEDVGVHPKTNQKLVHDTLTTLLWYKHGLNLPLMMRLAEKPFMYLEDTGGIQMTYSGNHGDLAVYPLCIKLLRMSGKIEGISEVVDMRGNVMMLTNHYGSNIDRGERSIEQILGGTEHYGDIVDIEEFETLQRLLPGTFDWRLIHFPFSQTDTHVFKTRFHRGTCLQLIFRFEGAAHKELVKSLKKVKLPMSLLQYDDPKEASQKRRRIDTPQKTIFFDPPPIIEMTLLKRMVELYKKYPRNRYH